MRRRYHEVMAELGDAIIGGAYAEGSRLPNVAVLHERFGCSAGVVREALRGLEERGLLEVHPGRGAKVRRREDWDTRNPHVLRACIERGPDPEVLWLAIEARAAVECEAAARAIAAAADADLKLLLGTIEAMERAAARSEPSAFDAAEVWFHRTLALLSDNMVLAKLGEPLHAVLADVRRERAPQRDSAAIRHHRRILEGVSSRDTELAAQSILGYAERLSDWVGARRLRS
jgi:DNA-binding FadR family transcriptional regulator